MVAKYSALPVVIAFGVFFCFQSGERLPWGIPANLQTGWFLLFLFLPGFVVYLLNVTLTGQGTAQVHGAVPLFPIGIAQIWNLAVPPVMELSGWDSIAFHLHLPRLLNAVLYLPAIAILACLGWILVNARRSPGSSAVHPASLNHDRCSVDFSFMYHRFARFSMRLDNAGAVFVPGCLRMVLSCGRVDFRRRHKHALPYRTGDLLRNSYCLDLCSSAPRSRSCPCVQYRCPPAIRPPRGRSTMPMQFCTMSSLLVLNRDRR